MFSGQWPEPQVGPSRIEGGKLIPVTEAERREKFFEAFEDGHPLMDLIHRCINNDPQLRSHAREIARQVSRVATQFPASFSNRLEMLRRIETVEEQTRVLREEKDIVIQQNKVLIVTLQQEAEQKADEIERLNMIYSSEVKQLKLEVREAEQKAREIERFSVAYTSEVEQLKFEVRDLNSQNELLVARHKAEVAEYKIKIEISDSMRERCLQQEKELSGSIAKSLQEKDAVIMGMKKQLTKTREYLTNSKQQVSSCA
jgi:trichohyalin